MPLLRPALLLTGLLLAACGDQQATAPAAPGPGEVAFNDFDNLLGWVPNPQGLTQEHAHSGRFAVRVDGAVEFAHGYGLVLSRAFNHRPAALRIEGWAYMPDANATALLALQLFDPAVGKASFGENIAYADAVKDYARWVKISKDIRLPATLNSQQELRVFLYRAGATSPAYLDDLRITELP